MIVQEHACLTFRTILVLIAFLLLPFSHSTAIAQGAGILQPGDAAVTLYGSDPDDPVLKIMGLGKINGQWNGRQVQGEEVFSLSARTIGQVFGVAFDDASPANIYVTATSAHGLRVEGRGKNAKWAAGQFGIDAGGGPGTIWKIDGETGDASVFANVELTGLPNSGPGLGNIAFDPISRQLFVSDRDTGLIHRFDLEGNDLGKYDHGGTARPTTGQEALLFDPANRLDITADDYNSKDPSTWGYANPGRAVWGLAVNGGRLYYAIEEGPQVWSVGIDEQGRFADDPRHEIDLPASASPNPISDIAFTADRKMVLAQRGGTFVTAVGPQHHRGGENAVLVYTPETPDDPDTPGAWQAEPEIMAVGASEPFRQAAGGIAIGHGYAADGTLDMAACSASVWATGDALMGEGAAAIHGIQGQRATSFTGDASESMLMQVLDATGDTAAGLMGDIAIRTSCEGIPVAELPPYEGPTCPSDDARCLPPPPDIIDPPEQPQGPDLAVAKIAHGERCNKGEECFFEVLVRNVGTQAYFGPVTFEDETTLDTKVQNYGPTPPWTCAEGDFIAAFCRHQDVYLAPGEGVSVSLSFTVPADYPEPVFRNCAALSWAPWQGFGDINALNDRACDYVPVCQPGDPGCGADLLIEQIASGFCEVSGICRVWTRMTNVGGTDYTGPLSFNVAEYTSGLVLQSYQSTVEWSCGATNAENYRCFSGPVTLSPGESRTVSIILRLPDDFAETSARQCVQITQLPGGGDENAGNNYACTEFRVCREGEDCPADLALRAGGQCYADPDPHCRISVIARNVGGEAFPGPPPPIAVINELGEGAGFLGESGTYYTCSDQGGGTARCTMDLSAFGTGNLPPGQPISSYLRYDVSGITEKTRRNCVKIDWGAGQSDANTFNDEYCFELQICNAQAGGCPVDLAATYTRNLCFKGSTCLISAPQVRNLGTNAFNGSFSANITRIPGLEPSNPVLRRNNQPVGNCAVTGAGISCTSGTITMYGTGAQQQTFVRQFTSYDVPEDFERDTASVCLELQAINGPDENKGNNRRCTTVQFRDPLEVASAKVDPVVDLAVTKRLLGACTKAGATCRYRINIANAGTKEFNGGISLNDVLSPAAGRFVQASNPWRCSGTATGANCARQGITLAPGASENFDIAFTLSINAQGEISNCAKLNGVEDDRNAANDEACVSVTIDAKTIEPPPPPPVEKIHDLAISLQGSPNCQTKQQCSAQVLIRNVGQAPYAGPLNVYHSLGNSSFRPSGGGGWNCNAHGRLPTMQCLNGTLSIPVGGVSTYTASFTPNFVSRGRQNHCATITWGQAGGAGVREAQAKLNQLGFKAGTPDGQIGPQTRRAVRAYQQSQRITVTGQLDQATLARLLGSGQTQGDSNRSNDKFCLDMNVTEAPKPTCSGGMVWNGRQCVCPTGLTLIGGVCKRPPVPPTCTGGTYWDGKRCVCPRGTQLINGICRKPQVSCPYPGQIIFNGKCQCRPGTRLIKGVCRTPPPPVTKCPYQGQIRLPTGQCICLPGQKLINGACRKPATACTADKILKNGQCVCRPGWSNKGGICQPGSSGGPTPCPPGQVRNSHGGCSPVRGRGTQSPTNPNCPDALRKLGMCQ